MTDAFTEHKPECRHEILRRIFVGGTYDTIGGVIWECVDCHKEFVIREREK